MKKMREKRKIKKDWDGTMCHGLKEGERTKKINIKKTKICANGLSMASQGRREFLHVSVSNYVLSHSHTYIALSLPFPFFPFLALSLFVTLLAWQPICCTCQIFFFCLYYALCLHISFFLVPTYATFLFLFSVSLTHTQSQGIISNASTTPTEGLMLMSLFVSPPF